MPTEPTATDSVEIYIASEADSLKIFNDSLFAAQDTLTADSVQQSIVVEPLQPAGFEGIPRKESFATQSSVTLLLLVQFFFLAFSFQVIVRQTVSFFKSFDFSRQTSIFTSREIIQTILLFVFSNLNISLLFYLLFSGEPTLIWLDLLPILIGFIVLFLFKATVFRFLGYVFFDKILARYWIQSNFVVLVLFNMLIFPMLVWVIYFRAPDSYLLYTAIFGAVSALALVIYRLLNIFTTRIYSFFHIILYLCTLEIMPLLLLYFVLTKMQILN